jgi:predicted transcriptional regulator
MYCKLICKFLQAMTKTSENTSITIRCPSTLSNSIDEQATQTKQNKTDVILNMLLSSIPSLHITQRAKLPSLPGIYFVYTPDHVLLYIGKADNLRTRWNSHHKYQYFIESSMECRIGYFTFDSIDSLSETIEEFKAEPIETITGKALVTADQFEELRQQVEALKEQFNNTFSTLAHLGIDAIAKKMEAYQPPHGLQQWNHTPQDTKEGITRSDLIKKLGFDSTKAFEDTAAVLELDPIKYLEELSGWQNRPVEEGSSRTRFFPLK